MSQLEYPTRVMYQEWRHLLFLHWKYEKEELQKSLPEGLYVDTFENEAYVSIVPFFINNLRVWHLPPVPFLSNFIEVNVRTYVYDRHGTHGIWFYSLDINSFLATAAARQFFFLPYHRAQLNSEIHQEIKITGTRNKAHMEFAFHPNSQTSRAKSDSLDFFLLERYVLFTSHKNTLYSERISHKPYEFSRPNVISYNSNLLDINNIKSMQQPKIVHYCPGLNVNFFPLKKVI